MPNMDYPGPCPSCTGIDGCATGASREEAQARFCGGLNEEFNTWRGRLIDVLNQDNVADLGDHIALIKSSVRELEDIAGRMGGICSSDLGGSRADFNARGESPGWLGG